MDDRLGKLSSFISVINTFGQDFAVYFGLMNGSSFIAYSASVMLLPLGILALKSSEHGGRIDDDADGVVDVGWCNGSSGGMTYHPPQDKSTHRTIDLHPSLHPSEESLRCRWKASLRENSLLHPLHCGLFSN